jgi:IS30 family transposase
VRWYCRSALRYRDIEELMIEQGMAVDHTTIYRWVQQYEPEIDRVKEKQRSGKQRDDRPSRNISDRSVLVIWRSSRNISDRSLH